MNSLDLPELTSEIVLKTEKLNSTPGDDLTAYDINSIMHYDGTLGGFFSSDPVMKDKITGKSIEVNREMSPIDIRKLNEMYPCKSINHALSKL